MGAEFDLIARYFSRPVPPHFLGGGDDCALLPVEPGLQLATSTDLLVEGRHFFSGSEPRALGHKALAVNLSDLAAMGAQPLACVLGLSLPSVDAKWLAGFSNGFYALADLAQCPLVGGDTTRSMQGICISVTVFGQVDPAKALRRSAAQVGDDIWVSGTLGAAYVALLLQLGEIDRDDAMLAATRAAMEQPTPPWQFAVSLAGVARAALDISDGLAQDLGHILDASHCGAQLTMSALPLDPAIYSLPESVKKQAALAGGDVYQLCFTAAQQQRTTIIELAAKATTPVTCIGKIIAEKGLFVQEESGSIVPCSTSGFDHFSD